MKEMIEMSEESQNPHTEKKHFDIFIPATEDSAARKVATIGVDVYIDEDGEETLTQESLDRIEQIQARYMGRMSGADILKMRERLGITQDELADLLQCGKKSISRWENGRGYPSGLVNTMLRLLDEGFITEASLRAVQGPRRENAAYTPTIPARAVKRPVFTELDGHRIPACVIIRARGRSGSFITGSAEHIEQETEWMFQSCS